jgi:thiol-disulfide isomerase/thioredoxin
VIECLARVSVAWCGHCKALSPKWEELAKDMKKHSSLVIAKVDATANDIPAMYGVRGYPTIFLQKNDGSEPVKYECGVRGEELFTLT